MTVFQKISLPGALMFLLLAQIWSGPSVALTEELVAFSDESLRPRYQTLIEELRCPKCQNQNLADSNAPIAEDLRREIRRLLEEGNSDDEIKTYLRERYSDFVLYRPDVQANTLFLWVAPVAVVVSGLVIVLLLVARQRRRAALPGNAHEVDRQRLEQLLNERDDAQ